MIKIGILGDIGSGKSYVAKSFGYPVFNADAEVGKLYKKDKIGLDFKDLKYTNPKKTYKSENDKKRITNSSKLFYDAIYMQGDKETDFLSTGKKLGHETMDGSLMFLHQAAESFRIWHETEPRTDWDGKAQIEDLQDLKLYYLL